MVCAPGWRRSRWWWTGSAHAAANRGSLCGSGSAVSAGPPPGAEGTMTLHPFRKQHRDRRCRTSFRSPRPRSPAGATAMCTSPGRQTLQGNEVRGERREARVNKDELGVDMSLVAKAAWFVSYLGCWRLLVPLHSHCDHMSRSPDPEDPPAPACWPAGPMSLLATRETDRDEIFYILFVFINYYNYE